MSRHFEESFRAITSFQADPEKPGRLIMEVYEDGYTPLDVVWALTMWAMETPDILDSFRNYINTDGLRSEEPGERFTGEEAEAHLRLLTQVFIAVSAAPGRIVYVTGNKGWVN